MSNKKFYPDQVFVDRFTQMVKKSGMRVTMIARLMDTERNTIYDYMKGVTQPRVSQLKLICKATKTSVDWLLGLED